MTLTAAEKEKGSIARYTQDEKDILFDLFKAYEEIIDIKHRKKSRRKTMEVRQCWQEILDSYNNDPRIATRRNLKQLQKFWLNARLRKRYPLSHGEGFNHVIKEISRSTTPQSPSVRESQLSQNQRATRTPTERKIKYEIQILNESTTITADTANRDTSASDPRQISIETISNDNLSLNDLLEFKTSDQHGEIVEVKTIRENINSTAMQNRDEIDEASAPMSTIFYNNVMSADDEDQEEAESPRKQQGRQRSHVSCRNSCCCHRHNTSQSECRYLDERINSYRIMEAEMKFKEQQLKTEKQKVELDKSRQELKYLTEMHELQLQEMRMKMKLLEEKSKRIE